MSTILNYRYINARLASSGQPLAWEPDEVWQEFLQINSLEDV